ncbi:hypothetical protein [Streptomyces sp. KL116D]|uniref:hypothetical protein n=1 Tax=Streptomyces sp. KL116D TaxID=3045152 RepID=UPI003559192C
MSARRTTKLTDDAVPLPLDPPDRAVTDDAAYRKAVDCLGDDVCGRPCTEARRVPQAGRHPARHRQPREDRRRPDGDALPVVTPSAAAAEKGGRQSSAGETAAGERFAGSKVTVGDGGTVVSMTWKNSTESGMRPGDQDAPAGWPRLLLWP